MTQIFADISTVSLDELIREGSAHRRLVQPELSVSLSKPEVVFCSGGLAGNLQRSVFTNTHYSAMPIYCVDVRECRAVPRFGAIFTSDGKVLEESLYGPRDWAFTKIRGQWAISRSVLRDISESTPERSDSACLFTSRHYRNYTHWHVESIATMLLCRKDPLLQCQTILTGPLTDWQKDSLNYFRLPSARVIQTDACCVEVNVLTYCSSVIARTCPHPSVLQSLRSSLEFSKHTDSVRVYVSRRDSQFRPLSNEMEVERIFHDCGFTVILASELTYAQQASLFLRASVIAGAHGSGLTNMLFAPPGTLIIELRPDGISGRAPFMDKSYWILANLCGHRYAAFIAGNPNWDAPDWRISCSDLTLFLKRTLPHTH